LELKHELGAPLWAAVKEHYEQGLCRDAVLDAVGQMTELLRTKAGLDGDGVPLCGMALGGTRLTRERLCKKRQERDGTNSIER
jgi:hypothetical protein